MNGPTPRALLLAFALALSCAPRDPTYEADVRPILARSCVSCHSPTGTASTLQLLTYEDALRSAGHLRTAVQSRMMPPWGADNSGLCNRWRGALWLSDAEVATLVAWSEGAHPRGEPRSPPEVAVEPQPFRADATVATEGPFTPELGRGFRCFVVDPKLSGDRLLTAIRVRSTEPRSVAQIELHALDALEQEREAQRLDSADPGPGYACFGSSRVRGARLLASWTWDGPILRLPQGTGLPLRAGRKLILQIHYNPIATGPVPTRTRVDLELWDRAQPGVQEAEVVAVQASSFELPPERSYTRVEVSAPFAGRARLLAVAPRMHTLARSMQLDLAGPGRTGCLANFDHWSFFRQRLFEYREPQQLSPGDVLHLTCIYTTQGKERPVRSGDTIADEECAAFLYVVREPRPR